MPLDGTEIRSDFPENRFCRLSPAQKFPPPLRFRLCRKLHSGGDFFAFHRDSLRWTRGRKETGDVGWSLHLFCQEFTKALWKQRFQRALMIHYSKNQGFLPCFRYYLSYWYALLSQYWGAFQKFQTNSQILSGLFLYYLDATPIHLTLGKCSFHWC